MTDKPAIPTAFPWTHGDMTCTGMTLRDYFAAKALQGMLAESGGGALHNTNLSEFAYLIADAMLKARNGD